MGLITLAAVVGITHNFVPVPCCPVALPSRVNDLVEITSGQDERRRYGVLNSSPGGLEPSPHRDRVFRTAG